MWNLKKKNDTNELIYKTETDPQTQKTNAWLPKGKRGREGLIRNLQSTPIYRYTPLYIKDIASYSTENSTQYLVTTHNGK